jgi:hypothetical protein
MLCINLFFSAGGEFAYGGSNSFGEDPRIKIEEKEVAWNQSGLEENLRPDSKS